MIKKISMTVCLAMLFLLTGCDSGKGDDFVGRWTGENKSRMFKPSYVMDISRIDSNFHIDIETTSDLFGDGELSKSKQQFEAEAESDNVLSMMGGMLTMRLSNNKITFDGTEFEKSR